jgi:hypothetical protein
VTARIRQPLTPQHAGTTSGTASDLAGGIRASLIISTVIVDAPGHRDGVSQLLQEQPCHDRERGSIMLVPCKISPRCAVIRSVEAVDPTPSRVQSAGWSPSTNSTQYTLIAGWWCCMAKQTSGSVTPTMNTRNMLTSQVLSRGGCQPTGSMLWFSLHYTSLRLVFSSSRLLVFSSSRLLVLASSGLFAPSPLLGCF